MSPKDLKLPIDTGKLKQLKSMTSPLSKIAKGVQNIGMNLDPRKIATKVNICICVYRYIEIVFSVQKYCLTTHFRYSNYSQHIDHFS